MILNFLIENNKTKSLNINKDKNNIYNTLRREWRGDIPGYLRSLYLNFFLILINLNIGSNRWLGLLKRSLK